MSSKNSPSEISYISLEVVLSIDVKKMIRIVSARRAVKEEMNQYFSKVKS